LFPATEDLIYLAKPFTEEEKQHALALGKEWNKDELEDSYPVSFIGTGADQMK